MKPDPEKRLTSALFAEMAANPKVRKVLRNAGDQKANSDRKARALKQGPEAYAVAAAREEYLQQQRLLIKQRVREEIGDARDTFETGAVPASIALVNSTEDARRRLVSAAKNLRRSRANNR